MEKDGSWIRRKNECRRVRKKHTSHWYWCKNNWGKQSGEGRESRSKLTDASSSVSWISCQRSVVCFLTVVRFFLYNLHFSIFMFSFFQKSLKTVSRTFFGARISVNVDDIQRTMLRIVPRMSTRSIGVFYLFALLDARLFIDSIRCVGQCRTAACGFVYFH